MTETRWVPEGDWEDYGKAGAVRYLRGDGEGGQEIKLYGMKPGATVRVLPDGVNKARARGMVVRAALAHAEQTPRILRLNSDDKAAWLIGVLWSKGLRGLEYHVDVGHRIDS